MKSKKNEEKNPWLWVPSLYLAEGLPYVVVMTVSVIMYKRLDVSNTEIALYTSWLYLPWVIKPFWSPVVDLLKTKRFWIIIMQFFIGAGLAGVALTLPTEKFFQYTLAFFWLLSFSSATHDIAADGFYMLGLKEHQQAYFVGIRSTFYRLAMLSGQGLLVILAGQIEESSGDIPFAWMVTFLILAGLFVVFLVYHLFILPHPKSDSPREEVQLKHFVNEFLRTFISFFKRKEILIIILFILLYRFAEAQLVKMASPFLLDDKEVGGLALTTSQVGIVYGTIGIIALSLGGILGGIAASRKGLKFWIWWMLIAINLPDLVYVYLAATQTSNFILINICVAVEQFGYGFGFTAFMLYLIYISDGEYKTAHYAIATGLMALGMMLPGMISGWIQEEIGYLNFFIWVCISTIPAFIITNFLKIDPEFGKKKLMS
jgi:MFS transporter, PAT family, beta-lactamase induction signal transducer AmpG